MSRVNTKPCCKVCKDAGKSAEEYSSHWPRDNAGATVCPTLLSQECRYCEEYGHTVKYCTVLAKDKTEKAKTEAFWARQKRIKAHAETKVTKPSAVAPVSRFALLMDDDDSDESPRSPKRTQKKAPKEEFPALSSKVAVHSPITGSSWSRAVTMGSSERVAVPVEKSGLCEYPHKTKELSAREKAAAIHRQECFKGLNGKGWGDLDDSADEEQSEAEEEMAAEDAW
jgi:Nanos RNA binding domain